MYVSPPAPLALAVAVAAETAGALSGIATVPPTPRGGFICNYRREKEEEMREEEGRKKRGGRIRPALRRRQGEGRGNFMPNMVIGTVMKS